VDPQEVPSQVAVLLAGTGHAVHDEPQLAVLVLRAQLFPQAW
jgi:Zn-dependent membrane protease YugP